MTEKIMDINAVPSYLVATLRTKKVKVQEVDHIITIIPIEDVEDITTEKKFTCPFLGIAADSSLTVDKFLKLKREERQGGLTDKNYIC